MRRAANKDKTQGAIVKAVRAAGYEVVIINQDNLPDLLVTAVNWVLPNRGSFAFFRWLETKSRRRKDGSVVLDPRQKKQAAFCAKYRVDYVTTPEEALEALRK